MSTKTETRSIEVELTIDAAPDAVWKALTDADELRRWFPLDARVEPGEGGYIALRWAEAHQGQGRITRWEPGRHLQTGWSESTDAFGEVPRPSPRQKPSVFETDPEAAKRLLVDYRLEAREGGTLLRTVHSGFSTDASWDEELESHRRGWNFELRSLRNYLNHHRGRTRSVAWVLQPVSIPIDEAWERLTGPDGLVREGTLEGVRRGGRYAITSVHGQRFTGDVFNLEPPAEFAGTAENLDHALLRFGIETWTGRPEAQFWLSSWTDPALVERLRGMWTEKLAALFA